MGLRTRDFGAGLQKGQVPDSLDLIPGGVGGLKDGGTRDAYLLVWETLRAFPPVFGVPLPGKDGKGEHAVVAWALHDPLVVGQDANIFMWDRATRAKRGDGSSGPLISLLSLGQDALQWYDEISMGFSDAAAPGFGTPSFDEAKVPSVPSSRHRGTRALAQASASHSVCRVHSWRRLSWKAVQRDGR